MERQCPLMMRSLQTVSLFICFVYPILKEVRAFPFPAILLKSSQSFTQVCLGLVWSWLGAPMGCSWIMKDSLGSFPSASDRSGFIRSSRILKGSSGVTEQVSGFSWRLNCSSGALVGFLRISPLPPSICRYFGINLSIIKINLKCGLLNDQWFRNWFQPSSSTPNCRIRVRIVHTFSHSKLIFLFSWNTKSNDGKIQFNPFNFQTPSLISRLIRSGSSPIPLRLPTIPEITVRLIRYDMSDATPCSS